MSAKKKTVGVFPAYCGAETLERTVRDVPRDVVDEMILVGDGSRDATVEIAQRLGLKVYRHYRNMGSGAEQKTCYTLALNSGADIAVMPHPDYQYDPKPVKYFAELISEDYFDVMLGTRIRSRREAQAGGMPLHKYVSNRALTFWENLAGGQNLPEWHTGMRAYHRRVLESIDFMRLSNDFVLDSQMLSSIVEKGYTIGEISVPVRYFKETSSINLWRSLKYGLGTIIVSLRYVVRQLLG